MVANPKNVEFQRVKGPIVWLDMDQQELDDAYDQTVYAPNQPLVTARRKIASQAVLVRFPPERHAYGPSEIEKLDIFKTTRSNAPVMVFIHGGAWRNGTAKDFAFQAELYLNAGVNLVIVDFAQVQDTGGDLLPMAQQVRCAIGWVYKNVASFGGNPERLYVSGHSSGAHLTGCALVTDWEKDFGLPGNFIKGALLVSGMYDLKPLRMSKHSQYVNFTDEVEAALSSQCHMEKLRKTMIFAYGTVQA